MIYVASKVRHAKKWLAFRDAGYPINSTWLNEAGPGETKSFEDLWIRCCLEAKQAGVLVAYREKGETLKGAMIEIGVALSVPKPVLVVGDWEGMTFLHHPTVKLVPNLSEAMAMANRILKASSETIITRTH